MTIRLINDKASFLFGFYWLDGNLMIMLPLLIIAVPVKTGQKNKTEVPSHG